jgi:hypothetical protein
MVPANLPESIGAVALAVLDTFAPIFALAFFKSSMAPSYCLKDLTTSLTPFTLTVN